MSKKRAKGRALLLAAMLSLALLVGGCGEKDSQVSILLVAKSSESYFWLTCFQGAEAAAVEYTNVDLTIVSPEVEWDYETQNGYILQAVEDGVSAIIFSACDYEKSVGVVEQAMDSGIPVVTIDSGINTARDISFIGTDNYEAGRMAAAAVVEQVGTEAGVGIVSFEESSGNGGQRVQGFLDYMDQYPGIEMLDIKYSPSDYDIAQGMAADMMDDFGGRLHAIATFNELTTIGVGRASVATGDTGRVCVVGFDNNTEAVQMLEDGYIDALIVQNSFAMGYLGLEQALLEMRGEPTVVNVDTGTVTIHTGNMYNPEMEKLLFPFTDSED